METNKKEGENYLKDKHQQDAAFQSPAEKKRNQQQDIDQNKQNLKPADQPGTNTTLGAGNQMEGMLKATNASVKLGVVEAS